MYISYLKFDDDRQEYHLDFSSQERTIHYYNDIRQWASDIDWTPDLHEQLEYRTVRGIACEYAIDGVDNWEVHNGYPLVMSVEERQEVIEDLANAIVKEIEQWLESEDAQEWKEWLEFSYGSPHDEIPPEEE
jgi:hypothetical protein